jgi:hypothetical protein
MNVQASIIGDFATSEAVPDISGRILLKVSRFRKDS